MEFVDTCERFRRMKRRASVVIGAHDDAEILDRGRSELASEAADAVIGEFSLAAVMREVMHDQWTDVGDQVVWSADALEKGFR